MARGPERRIFPVLRELGIGVTAYGVLAHGMLGGRAKPAGPGDARSHLPWFQPGNFERNQALVEALGGIARGKGVTTGQLATAWVLAQGPAIVPIIGARTHAQLDETLAALAIALTADDLTRIERAVPPDAVAGTRYAAPLMKMLDSEREG